MATPFLDRQAELARLRQAVSARDSTLTVVYGRRRLGKSRLVQEALPSGRAVYFVGDDRDPAVQREALAVEIGRSLPGFERVTYAGWSSLLERWWRDAADGAVLALDELPALVLRAPELPSLLQRRVDDRGGPVRHLVLCGSSQRMMHGLVLDASAPLYGRAREILKVGPLPPRWLGRLLRVSSAVEVVEHWAVWGGVPRYWELAAQRPGRAEAIRHLVLDPLGVLHREPDRILRDDLDDTARAASLLGLVARGVARASELAGRLQVPATSLARPLARLIDLGLLAREVPFGRSVRDTKRTLYRVADPLLRFWFRFVDPNLTRLEAGLVSRVAQQIERDWPGYLGLAWEELCRRAVPHLAIAGETWSPAARWWGRGVDGGELELDVVAASDPGGSRMLVGEVKLSVAPAEERRLLASLRERAARCPDLLGKEIVPVLFVLRAGRRRGVIGARQVVEAVG